MSTRVLELIAMRRALSLAAVVLAGCFGNAAAAGGVSLVGAQFSQPPYHGDTSLSVLNNMQGGAKLVLLATVDSGNIIDFDRTASAAKLKVSYVAKDGRETQAPGGAYSLWPFITTGKDGKSALVEIHFKSMPPADVQGIHVSGQLVLTTAASLATAQVKDVPLRKGEKFTLGPAPVEVTGVGKPRLGGSFPVEVRMKSDESFKRIRKVEFFDAQGASIESSKAGTWTMGFGGVTSVETGFGLRRQVKSVSIKAQYWQGVDRTALPVDFSIRRPF